MNRKLYLFPILLCVGLLAGCFSPSIYLRNKPNFAVDVFYDTQRPPRPFDPLEELETRGEVPLVPRQSTDKRMLSRGNDMQQKDFLLSRLSMQAKKIGADALVAVRYTYYTSQTDNGYIMSGLAVKYKKEN